MKTENVLLAGDFAKGCSCLRKKDFLIHYQLGCRLTGLSILKPYNENIYAPLLIQFAQSFQNLVWKELGPPAHCA